MNLLPHAACCLYLVYVLRRALAAGQPPTAGGTRLFDAFGDDYFTSESHSKQPLFKPSTFL